MPAPRLGQLGHHGRAQEAVAAGDHARAGPTRSSTWRSSLPAGPPIVHAGRIDRVRPGRARLTLMAPLRVAVTLEQCWHRVPGGTASSALEAVRALQARPDLELIGVSARHRRPPPEPWVPTDPGAGARRCRARPSTSRGTGSAARRSSGPPAPSTWSMSPAWPCPRPSAPLVVTVHDLSFLDEPGHSTRRGLRFFHRAVELARRDAALVACPSQADHRRVRRRSASTPARLRLVPWGVDAAPGRRGRGRPGAGHLPPRTSPTCMWAGHDRAAQEPAHPARGLPPARPPGPRARAGRAQGLERGPRAPPRLGRRPGAPTRVRARGRQAGPATRGPRCSACPACGRASGCPVLEAMAQGAPVVTSQGTAAAEVAGDAAVLVDPLDATALAEAAGRGARRPGPGRAPCARRRGPGPPSSRGAEPPTCWTTPSARSGR